VRSRAICLVIWNEDEPERQRIGQQLQNRVKDSSPAYLPLKFLPCFLVLPASRYVIHFNFP